MKTQNPPARLNAFPDMNLPATLLAALSKMEISKPTDIQAQAIPAGLSGLDLIAVAQTGSGKTLAYALPVLNALIKNPSARVLVLVPSREMAQQVHRVFLALTAENPMSTVLVIGGVPSAKQISALNKKPQIVIATPGRLNDHLVNNKLLLQNIEHIIIDEADRMLDIGFTPQLKNIQSTLRGKRQTLMFSASFNPDVEAIAQLFMNPQTTLMIRSDKAEKPVESLKQRVLFIDKSEKNDRLLDELNATKGGVIVFCQNQGGCERTGQYLKQYGFSTDLIHAGLTQGHRNRVVREFREGEIRILVTTDLLARGLDVPHVDHVINFELPAQPEDFLHRIGRTARAGRGGDALTFVTPFDKRHYTKIKQYLIGATEIKLNPKFEFAERPTGKFAERYKSKTQSQKKAFDPEKKPVGKPESRTIGNINKPNKYAKTEAEETPSRPSRGTFGKPGAGKYSGRPNLRAGPSDKSATRSGNPTSGPTNKFSDRTGSASNKKSDVSATGSSQSRSTGNSSGRPYSGGSSSSNRPIGGRPGSRPGGRPGGKSGSFRGK
jgi:ATP-dependent RNA helicase RhlE